MPAMCAEVSGRPVSRTEKNGVRGPRGGICMSGSKRPVSGLRELHGLPGTITSHMWSAGRGRQGVQGMRGTPEVVRGLPEVDRRGPGGSV